MILCDNVYFHDNVGFETLFATTDPEPSNGCVQSSPMIDDTFLDPILNYFLANLKDVNTWAHTFLGLHISNDGIEQSSPHREEDATYPPICDQVSREQNATNY